MIKEIDIDKIYFRLFDEDGMINPTKIEKSPVYNAICGNPQSYTEYHARMVRLGRAKAGYMTTEDFLEFDKNFNYLEPPYENEYVRVKKTGHLYGGWDGAHRISCEKKRGKKTIKVELMSGDFKHKGYSNLIDVPKIFDNIDYDDYIIIKDDDMFPKYTDRDDLDIICKDRKVLCEYILKELEVYKEYGYEIVVKEKGVRHHIDLIPPGFVDMNYRIDLLDEFPYLQQFHHHTNKIEVKDDFYDFLLERKVKKEFEYLIMFGQDGTFEVNFPNQVDDLVVRFMEWVWQPHKSRHINYVIKNIQNIDMSEFIDIVTGYTNIEVDDDYMKELLK